jgi:ubiquinone/menaquinone biosynthesis C-methylase UbiE
MLQAALERARAEGIAHRVQLALAPMDALPVADGSIDLVVAHGIWNLARTAAEFRGAVREASRAARDGAALFVFTFSRGTLPPDAQPIAGEPFVFTFSRGTLPPDTQPIPGEPFVFTEFSGQPQSFLTEAQLLSELAAAGFHPDPAVPLRELNRRPPGALEVGRAPVIYEGAFRRRRR